MFKKIFAFIIVCFAFCFTVLAKSDLYVFPDDAVQIAEVLNMTEESLKLYCDENNVTYLAVNSDNTKQIRKTETVDAVSEKILSLSCFSDSEILGFSKELSGFDATGEVIEQNGLKFLKIELQTEDGGGKYILTQYITIENSKKTVLTFYTADGVSRNYVQNIFEEQFAQNEHYTALIIAAAVILIAVAVVVTLLIIKELKKKQ